MKLIRYRSFRRHKPENCAWCAECACPDCGDKPPVRELPGNRMVHTRKGRCLECVKVGWYQHLGVKNLEA